MNADKNFLTFGKNSLNKSINDDYDSTNSNSIHLTLDNMAVDRIDFNKTHHFRVENDKLI